MYFDEAKIHLEAGAGGDGRISFRREKYVPHGGPDGGNGGNGGSIYLVASPHQNTLLSFRKKSRFKAEKGVNGQGRDRHGRYGRDLEIGVPMGTVAHDEATGEVLADLIESGQRVLVAQGGKGGRGNACFATSTNQAPRIATRGDPGVDKWVRLELKLIADVGIVGMPNAGKSTLLSVITAAKPKIADYPFTTLEPNLGVVDLGDRTMVVADLPGLIEGAHSGAGLGHQFLRHVERTRVLIHLLNGAAEDPMQDLQDINDELELFQPGLSGKPQLVVLNKMDLPEAQGAFPRIEEAMEERGQAFMAISAVTVQGTREMLWRVAQMLQTAPSSELRSEAKVFRPDPVDAKEYEIIPVADGFRVRGAKIERIAARTIWSSFEAVVRFQNILKAIGIYQELDEVGIETGDTLYVGDYEFEWV